MYFDLVPRSAKFSDEKPEGGAVVDWKAEQYPNSIDIAEQCEKPYLNRDSSVFQLLSIFSDVL